MSAALAKRRLNLLGLKDGGAQKKGFWQVLEHWAAQKEQPLPTLVASIDAARTPSQSLAYALRVFALKSLQNQP